jgi:hypothetical protein
MRVLGTKLARFAVMVLIGGGAASALHADNFVVSYNAAGSQVANSAALCSTATICWVGEETFGTLESPETLPGAASYTNLADIGAGGGSIQGTYSTGLIVTAANEYGGALGTGFFGNVTGDASPNNYSLTLQTSGNLPGVNYFGLWFSALDGNNQLVFKKNGNIVETFTPADFISLVGTCPTYSTGPDTGTPNPFCGNPNTGFLGNDNGEQFAFLNFYDSNGYFDEIDFTELGGGGAGFESDNHTVGYGNPITPEGTIIGGATPEPGTLALFGSGLLGLAGFARRRIGRRA